MVSSILFFSVVSDIIHPQSVGLLYGSFEPYKGVDFYPRTEQSNITVLEIGNLPLTFVICNINKSKRSFFTGISMGIIN